MSLWTAAEGTHRLCLQTVCHHTILPEKNSVTAYPYAPIHSTLHAEKEQLYK